MKRLIISFFCMIGLVQPYSRAMSLWPSHIPIAAKELAYINAPNSFALEKSGLQFDIEHDATEAWQQDEKIPLKKLVDTYSSKTLELKPLKIYDLKPIDGSDEYALRKSDEQLYIVDGEPPQEEDSFEAVSDRKVKKKKKRAPLVTEKVVETKRKPMPVETRQEKVPIIIAKVEPEPRKVFASSAHPKKVEPIAEPIQEPVPPRPSPQKYVEQNSEEIGDPPSSTERALPVAAHQPVMQAAPPSYAMPQSYPAQMYNPPMYQPQMVHYAPPIVVQPVQQPYYQNQFNQAAALAMQLQAQAMNMQAQASSLMMQAQSQPMMVAQNMAVPPQPQYQAPAFTSQPFAYGAALSKDPRADNVNKRNLLMNNLQELSQSKNDMDRVLLLMDNEFNIMESLLAGERGQTIEAQVYSRNQNLKASNPLVARTYDLVIDLAANTDDDAGDARLYHYFVRRKNRTKNNKFLIQMMTKLQKLYDMIEKYELVAFNS